MDNACLYSHAIPAFNLRNIEQMLSIMQATSAVNSSVIMQASRGGCAAALPEHKVIVGHVFPKWLNGFDFPFRQRCQKATWCLWVCRLPERLFMLGGLQARACQFCARILTCDDGPLLAAKSICQAENPAAGRHYTDEEAAAV